ncbi:MAG: ABC transporter permease [Propionibacteriaceae bacterium]|nr:ABC transporter permease [Propionibacteriaceae bacterium]
MAEDRSPETAVPAAEYDEEALAPLGRGRLTFRRFMRNRLAVGSIFFLIVVILIAAIGPFLWHWDYRSGVDSSAFLKPPSAAHPLGTMKSGLDVLAVLMQGLRKSLIIGVVYALLMTGIAAVLGSAAAYFGKWTERVVLWVTDLLLIVPQVLLVSIIMAGKVAPSWAWLALALLMAVLDWPLYGRIVRSMTMSVKQREYVQAARFMGLSSWRVIFRHILPNISSLLIVNITMGVGQAILYETTYSFLGFGIKPPDWSLGSLIQAGISQGPTTFPWTFAFAAGALVLVVLAVNAIGDGLRDALDPSSAAGGAA